MHITLEQIRAKSPCREGWTTLLKSLGNPSDLSTKVSFGDIAQSNGAADALWCLRCVDDRRFGVSMVLPAVKRATQYATDKRVNDCIAAIEQWLSGDDSVDLRAAARAAASASAAAEAAAYAAYAADAAAAYAAAERQLQIADIIAVSPPHALKGDHDA